jgi:hypothetical protein
MSTMVQTARQEWKEGYRRLEAERENPGRYRLLHEQVDAVTEELRRRIGTVFMLAELVEEYRRSDPWVHAVIAELPAAAQWPAGMTTAADAAFHLYARGAQDYAP